MARTPFSRNREHEALHAPTASVDLTVVVPYFNPGDHVGQTVNELLHTLEDAGATFEVIAVSDGSTDGSTKVVDAITDPRLRSVVLKKNRGKGEALRVGFTMGRGRFIGFIDADGDLPPEQLHLLAQIASGNDPAPDVILGSKRHPTSQVHYPPLRRFYSWCWQQAVLVLFHLHVRDTQTGMKLVRRAVLAEVLPRMVEERFAFDLELLVVARRLGFRNFVEVPVRIRERFSSTVSVKAALGMVRDLFAIFFRLHRGRYDHAPSAG